LGIYFSLKANRVPSLFSLVYQKNLSNLWRGVLSPERVNGLGWKLSPREQERHEDLPMGSDRKFARYWNGV
jgi:hypothetical protein